MEDFDKSLKQLETQFKKGEITFTEYSDGIFKWNNDFSDVIKAQTNGFGQDASHGGKLHKKTVYDKTGKKVTKWVSVEKNNNTGSKDIGVNGIETPVKQTSVEQQYSIEDWEKNASKASIKALEKASKLAGSDDVRRIARNELLKRSLDLGKFMNLSLLPDFMLDNYVSKYDDVKLTEKENEAIALYRDTNYYSLNKKLRADTELEPDEKKQLNKIDSAIDKSELKHDLTLYRGLNAKDVNNLLFINYLKSLKPGDTYQENSYSSTSIVQGQAFKFKDLYSSPHNIVLKIYASKGSKGLCMQSLGGVDEKAMYNDEYEFLLPRNSMFQIIETNDNEISIKLV